MIVEILDIEDNKAAQIALDNRLYVDGWLMKTFYERIINGNVMNYSISVAVVDGVIVGAATLSGLKKMVSVFVKDDYRKKGIGSNLLDSVLAKKGFDKSDVFAGQGILGSHEFFFKNKIMAIGSADMLVLQASANEHALSIERKLTDEGKTEDEIDTAGINEFFGYFSSYVKKNYDSVFSDGSTANYQTKCFVL